MKTTITKRLLSALLVLALVFGLMPATVLAADSVRYTQITSMDQLVTGKYVLVVNSGYAPTVLDGSWILAEAVTATEGVITDPAANLIWDLTVSGEGVTLTDSKGASIAPKGGNNNGITSGSYNWAVTCTDGVFRFAGTGSDTVLLASNKGSQNKFRGYKTATVSGNAGSYPSDFTLYKLAEAAPQRESGIITDLTQLQDGDTVVVFNPANMKALSSTYTGFYNCGVDVTLTEGKLSGYTNAELWTLGTNESGSYTFSTAEGKKLSLGANYSSMPLDDVNVDWEISAAATADCFYIKNVVRGNYIEWYADKNNWSSYYNIGSNESLFAQQLYLVVEEETEEPTDPSEPTDPEEPVEEFVPISDALAGKDGETFSVKGVITLLDGQNVYLQDATGGICVRMSSKFSDLALGDTIVGTGSKTVYNGLPQLGSGTYVKSEGLTLVAKNTTIAGLTTADICTYVALSGLEITEVYDNNGAYTTPNITLKDGSGNEIQLYKAIIGKDDSGAWEYTVGDMVDLRCAVSYYDRNNAGNGKFQLRNTVAAEVTPARQEGPIAAASDLKDGDTVVIYNPAHMMALSSNYSGYYNAGTAVTVTDGKLSGYTDADIWTVGVNENGSYTLSTASGQKLSLGASRSSMPLDDVNVDWEISAAATTGCFYIKNVARGNYIEWYADKNNWSSYYNIGNNEALFAQTIYLVTAPAAAPETGLPQTGDMVTLYNLDAKGVLALQTGDSADPTSCSIGNALATVENGKVLAENGGLVFKTEKNGDYFRFYNETFGYLCSTGTGNNAYYQTEASEDADWTVTSGKSGGWFMESRTAKFNGTYSQYLEYYAGAYKTYSMYNVTNYDIYEFFFYPCGNESLTGGVVNRPQVIFGAVNDAYVGTDYSLTFTVDAIFGVETLEVNYPHVLENGVYTVTVPLEQVTGDKLTITVAGKDTRGVAFSGTVNVTVKDEPVITQVTPAPGSETGENLRPTISAAISNCGEGASFTMTVNGEAVNAVFANGVLSYTPAQDMAQGRTTVTVTVTRADQKQAEKTWSFTLGEAQYQLYFGQLHSHTGEYSDGSGTLASALDYILNLPESANVDFVAFTDHSNYFDDKNDANPEEALYDLSLATAQSRKLWEAYTGAMAAFNASQSDVVALAGFEMTWSGGPGHINTFNTPGIVSRNNATLNNKTADAGMKAYYALLSRAEGAQSISQFNHPGSTFGTFTDFGYWDAVVDTRIQLVEVGNGEGQIGAGGYYPSYEYYTMALDKGWHVAPTNNQDNHKGKWGNANDARDVVLTDDFSQEGIYAAIRAYRVYATEDKNLEIGYTVNDRMLGSVIEEVPGNLDIRVTLFDPDTSDSISKVEVIVNSGKTAYTWDDPTQLALGELTCTLEPIYSYYYIRVTQGDGDLAVTAPVWVGETLKLGISSVECGTSTPVTGEEVTITTTLFNSEATNATVNSLVYTVNGSEVIGTDTEAKTITGSSTLAVDFKFTPQTAKLTTITVTAFVTMEGVDYQFSMDVELDVLDADSLVYIGIDASHYNEYVAGNYKDSMGNFGNLAAGYSVRTVELKTSEDLIAACENKDGKFKAIILTAPSRRLAAAQSDPRVYTADELAAIAAFNKAGGAVILAGWSDNYENYDVIQNNPDILHMAATQNQVLQALGSSLRIADDATYDDVRSAADGVDKWRLYFNTYGDSFLTEGVEYDAEHPYNRMYTEVFSHYGGASVYAVDGQGNAVSTLPATVYPVVYGHSTTYSVDVDGDGLGGNVPAYAYTDGTSRLMAMAMEQLEGQGLIIVSGAAFMSNFEVQATISDSGSEKNYSNYRICENLVQFLNPVKVTPIAEVRARKEAGFKYTIEGVVTSNASGYDKDTAFFDCIYVQDATGGICCFPVAGNYKIGDVVRITGTTEFYQGEPELQVATVTVLGTSKPVEPTVVTGQQVNDRSAEGLLVTVKGTVESVVYANELAESVYVRTGDGALVRVFMDGYITREVTVAHLEEGNLIEATGLASYDDTYAITNDSYARIRVRNRAEVVCTPVHRHQWSDWTVVTEPTCLGEGLKSRTCPGCGETEEEILPALGHDLVATVVKPTCTDGGYTHHQCSRCSYNYISDPVPAMGHSYTDLVKEPTCTDMGYTTHTCSVCKDTYVDGITDAKGHSYESVVTEPTHEKMGYTTHTCSACGHSYVDSYTDALGHNYTQSVTKEPTCTEEGTMTFTCACGKTYTQSIPKADHTYASVVTEPTCTEMGYTTHTCTACGHSYKADYTNATGHSFGKWTLVKEPTCVARGQEKRECHCGQTQYRDTDMLAHSYKSVVTEPTCTDMGYTTCTCSYCGDSYKTDYVAPLGHSYTGAVTKEPTCTEEGTMTFTCACGHSYTESIPMTAHSYEAVVTAPTCTEMGYTTYTCTACGHSYKADYTNATGHSFGKWETVKEATCIAKGQQMRACACGAKEYRETDMTAHRYESQVTEPTCTDMGYTTCTCSYCGDSYKTDYVAPLGHSYTGAVTKEPTCTEEGTMTFTCACGHSYTESIPMTAHSYEAVVTAPTCTAMGYTTYTCTACGHSYKADYTDATGHHCEETVIAPTCEDYGYTLYTCRDCDYSYTDKITQPTGHSFGQWFVAQEPTCFADGLLMRECADCDAVETQTLPATGEDCPSALLADLDSNAWYHDYVDQALKTGIMKGMDETHFSPNGTLTRAQVVTILYRMAGNEGYKTEAAPFADVEQGSWYADAVNWAYECGIVLGITDTTFAPNAPVTREQLVTFLYRFSLVLGMDMTTEGDLSGFSDDNAVSDYALEAMVWAVEQGLVNGMEDGTLAPGATATRAQTAKVMVCLMAVLGEEGIL